MAMNTFTLDVEGVGTFVFRRRKVFDRVGISALALKYNEDRPIYEPNDAGEMILTFEGTNAVTLATLERLTVKGPPGWDLHADDDLEPGRWDAIVEVFRRLREKEETFRPGAVPQRIQPGPGAEPDGGVPVSAPVQPAAD